MGYKDAPGSSIPLSVEVPGLVGLWIGLVGAAVAYSRRRGSGSLVADFGYRIGAWWDIPLGAALGLGSQYALIPLLYLPFEHVDHHLRQQLGEPTTRAAGSAHGSTGVAVVLLFLAVGAPLVEELFFRGLLMRSLAAWMPSVAAIVLTGVLFGLAHFEALQFAGLAVFGMVLAAAAWFTGRLGPSICAHVAFNVAAVLSVARFG